MLRAEQFVLKCCLMTIVSGCVYLDCSISVLLQSRHKMTRAHDHRRITYRCPPPMRVSASASRCYSLQDGLHLVGINSVFEEHRLYTCQLEAETCMSTVLCAFLPQIFVSPSICKVSSTVTLNVLDL